MDISRQPERTRLRRARNATVSGQQSAGGSDVVFGQYLEKEAVDAAHASTRFVGSASVLMSSETNAYEAFVEGAARSDGRRARS